MRRMTVIAITTLAILGCSSNDGPSATPMSTLERRSFQTREFDTPDTRVVMKAMINVLQDMGFQIQNADAQLGLLTATKWANIEHSKKEIKRARKDESVLSKSLVLETTANISEFGTQSRVRANFQERILNAEGATLAVNQIEDPQFYQTFFAQVDRGVFLQREGV
jgi:cytidylate kinase